MIDYHLDARMPRPEQCIQRYMIERWAREQPNKLFAIFADGEQWTYGEMQANAIRTANALRALGVKQGERVLVWLPNGADCLRAWFGLNYLGAVFVPINTAYRGALLEHAIALSEARLMIAHADLCPRLHDVNCKSLREIAVLGGAPSALDGVANHPPSALESADERPPTLERPIAPWDMQSIIFTSGTTGPSKGVMSSYVHLHAMAVSAPFLSGDDRYMVNLPMFHSGGVMPVTAMLIHGGSIAMVDCFSTESFWPTVRSAGITTSILLGVMGGFLLKRPPAPDDKDHPLKTCTYVPLNETAPQFHDRFGTDIYTHFNMTEISMPIVTGRTRRRSAAPAARVRVSTSALSTRTTANFRSTRSASSSCAPTALGDQPRLCGKCQRRRRPPGATAGSIPATPFKPRRRGQFLFRRPAEGRDPPARRKYLLVRGRVRKCSPFRAIREAAAIAVRSEIAEDEVMAVVAIREGAAFDPAELVAFLRERMAHFMVPRYVRIVEALPRTPTAKIEKVKLRADGFTPDTWDRERAGIVVKREKIGAKGA